MQSRVCASFRPLSEDSRCLWGDAGGPRGQRAGGYRVIEENLEFRP